MSKTAFVASSKTPTVHKKAKYRRTIILDDDEDTEDENWVEDLREYLKKHLEEYIYTENRYRSTEKRPYKECGSWLQKPISEKSF